MKQGLIIILFFLQYCSLSAQNNIVLENENIKAVFDTKTGSLVELTYKKANWNVVYRHELGQSFQMLVPVEGKNVPYADEYRYNNANGKDQKAPAVTKNANSVTFKWNDLKSVYKENLNISFTGTATLENTGIKFSGEVNNRSNYVVEYIAWPYLGEVAIPDKSQKFYIENNTNSYIKNLYPNFRNEPGYWGVRYPTKLVSLPIEGFLLFCNNTGGMYVSTPDCIAKEFMIGSLELIPGCDAQDTWYPSDKMDGELVRMQFKVNRVLYAQPESHTTLNTIVLRFYQGNKFEGADFYKKNMIEQAADPSINNPATWRRVNVSNAGQLISIARESILSGISCLLVNGWYSTGDTSFITVMPGLKDAIKQCQKIGCKVMLECNFTHANPHAPFYQSHLKDMFIASPYGMYYDNDRSTLCPAALTVQNYVKSSFAFAYKTTADGLLCNDIPEIPIGEQSFCHNPNHHPKPAFLAPAIIEMNEKFRKNARQINPRFLVGGQYLYDQQSAFLDFRVLTSVVASPMLRYINPAKIIVAPINIRNAREDINSCVLYKYNVCYDNLWEYGSLSEIPNIVNYAKSIEHFRSIFRNYIWDADMINPNAVQVTGNNIQYTVYQSRKTGKRCAVIANMGANASEPVKISFVNGASVSIATPENPNVGIYSEKTNVAELSLLIAIEN